MAPDPHSNHTSLVPPTTIELTSQRLDSTEVIAARGEIDLATAPQLARAVGAALAANPQRLVIDLCEVGFLDSSGLALLHDAQHRARAGRVALRVACDVASTRRVLALTGLDRELKVRPSRAEALDT